MLPVAPVWLAASIPVARVLALPSLIAAVVVGAGVDTGEYVLLACPVVGVMLLFLLIELPSAIPKLVVALRYATSGCRLIVSDHKLRILHPASWGARAKVWHHEELYGLRVTARLFPVGEWHLLRLRFDAGDVRSDVSTTFVWTLRGVRTDELQTLLCAAMGLPPHGRRPRPPAPRKRADEWDDGD